MDVRGIGSSSGRIVGDYILGPKIGSGSFAEVWGATHRQSGLEVAIKEIDKKVLKPKVKENLRKEIHILSKISHPNIVKLFHAIQTDDKIFLVMEYCDGGDLAGYIHKHGKVCEKVARHFMRHLAAGLQVLQDNHLIHRDLKPQNLLLSNKGGTPLLKIGDFGFARFLIPDQDLADTMCGSPLYMAPEIIQNQKYDAKADLWSVGAILYQLVTGKPPFDAQSQFELFSNILRATNLQFPEGAMEELHPDCIDLCRSLLRLNPVERLSFREFFSHKFLEESSKKVAVELVPSLPQSKSMVEEFDSSASEKKSQLVSGHPRNVPGRNPEPTSYDRVLYKNEYECSYNIKDVHHVTMPLVASDNKGKSVENQCSTDQPRVADSMESIEKGYVLVNTHSASMEAFSYYLGTSMQGSSSTRLLMGPAGMSDSESATTSETKENIETKTPQVQGSDSAETLSESTMLREVKKLSILHPSTRLQSLHQCVQAITELAQEKYNAGLFLESFSVELVILAIWKKALEICSSWMNSFSRKEQPGSTSGDELSKIQGIAHLSPISEYNVDFSRPSSAYILLEHGFIVAYDRAEKLSCHLRDMDANAEMPDAMEIIYQKALTIGKSGAEEYMENKNSAAASYSKAMLLLSFIVVEAPDLPLKPPFKLSPANKKRIQSYIDNLHSSISVLTSPPFPKFSPGCCSYK